MRLRFMVLAIWCLGFVCIAQQTESELLLGQAKSIVLVDPMEANRISEHVLKVSSNKNDKVNALYINAFSNYILGQYSKSLEKAFEAKNSAIEEGLGDLEKRSTELISRVFQSIQLKEPQSKSDFVSKQIEPAFIAEELLQKSKEFLLKDNLDSAKYLVEKVKKDYSLGGKSWIDALYFRQNGDVLFKEKKWELCLNSYQQALEFAEKIKNPFLLYEINQSLANTYLALDNTAKFQEYSRSNLKLNSEIYKLENIASNSAHMLMLKGFDEEQTQLKSKLKWVLIAVIGLLVFAGFLKILFFIRNRNKLKMYQNMLDYLSKQNQILTKTPELEVIEKVESPKSPVLLKESENQILHGLEKFESGTKFTNKDMSLSVLAGQLNTNTKYLSEVINRQKHKNFNTYINELRINYITEKIKTDPNYLNFKVSYLAEECGFSSHSTFTTVFKSIVGVSPIIFVEFVKDEIKLEKTKPVYEEV